MPRGLLHVTTEHLLRKGTLMREFLTALLQLIIPSSHAPWDLPCTVEAADTDCPLCPLFHRFFTPF